MWDQKKKCLDDRAQINAIPPASGNSDLGIRNATILSATNAETTDFDKYKSILYKYYNMSTLDYYIKALPAPIADEQTDSDGKFTMLIPKTGAWILEATGQRNVLDHTEHYFWFFNINGEMKSNGQVFLSNDNLATNFPGYVGSITGNEGSMLITSDPSTVDDRVSRDLNSLGE